LKEEQRFWAIIEQAGGDPHELAKILSPLSNEEISAFSQAYYDRLCELNQWRIWAAGFVIAGGMGDDSFHYFRSWIIGKGKLVFDTAMADPDDLGPFVDDAEVSNELLEYVALDALKKRGVTKDPRDRSKHRSSDANPTGEAFDEETVSISFPRLSARFG
jgi:Protein of unknown function (DUF4240)